MDGAWMRVVCGQKVYGEPATLTGFQRAMFRGESYPGLVPFSSGVIDGILYRNLRAGAWKRLDHYEGEYYQRRYVHIETPRGRLVAQCYCVHPSHRWRLASPHGSQLQAAALATFGTAAR